MGSGLYPLDQTGQWKFMKTYVCGCSAGPGDVPNYCPTHEHRRESPEIIASRIMTMFSDSTKQSQMHGAIVDALHAERRAVCESLAEDLYGPDGLDKSPTRKTIAAWLRRRAEGGE